MSVHLTIDGAVVGLTQVDIVISGATSKNQMFADTHWSASQDLGVYLDSSVSGAVMVQANGYAGTTLIASSQVSAPVTVVPGKATAVVSLTLVPVLPSGTGGAGGSGAGTGGAAGAVGAGGAGGAGGMTAGPGSGGAAGGPAGTGGAAGAPGLGGAGGGAGGKAGGKSWRGAMLAMKSALVSDTYPAAAVDPKGNIVIAYLHSSTVWANYFSATTGAWGTEGAIDAPAGSSVSQGTISVAVDKDGKWLVVWQQAPDVAPHGIWQSTSADGVHWSAAAAIATAGKLYEPEMAMNANGIAAVVWTESLPPDGYLSLNASVRAANGTWGAPHLLKAVKDTSERYVSLAVTGPGDVVIAWEQDDDRATAPETSIWMTRYASGAWQTAALVETYDADWASGASVATNKAGQVVVTWVQYGNASEMWARRYPATGAAEPPVKIVEADRIEYSPRPGLTLDDAGNATLAMAIESKNTLQAYTSRAAWGQAWSSPMAMETDNTASYDGPTNEQQYVVWPQVGHDDAGNVVLVWRKRVNTGVDTKGNVLYRWDLWARIFDASSSAWGAPTLLETRDKDTASPPHDISTYYTALSVGPSGDAVVGWYYGWDLDTWANIYR